MLDLDRATYSYWDVGRSVRLHAGTARRWLQRPTVTEFVIEAGFIVEAAKALDAIVAKADLPLGPCSTFVPAAQTSARRLTRARLG